MHISALTSCWYCVSSGMLTMYIQLPGAVMSRQERTSKLRFKDAQNGIKGDCEW